MKVTKSLEFTKIKEFFMNKLTKTLLIICLAVIMCFTSVPITAFAADNDTQSMVTPRWSHLSDVVFSFSAISSGGHVDVSYAGYPDTFSKVDIHVKLQKKFLLVFWTDVDEWSVSSTEVIDDFYHCFTLNGTGTYKATLTFTATGTDGSTDSFTNEIESKYSK